VKYFVANWKMNMELSSVKNWIEKFEGNKEDVIIACSTSHFHTVKESGYNVCSQDVSMFEKGAHTGETGAFQIADYCSYSIVGHSERSEDFETVIKKRDLCLKEGVTPIVCFTKPGDALQYYAENCILAWEDPQNISVDGVYREKAFGEVRTNIHLIKAGLPEGAEVIYGGSVNRQNIAELASIEGLNGVLVGNASLDPGHFYEICRFKSTKR
jgi:triosephosphate isomerase